MAGILSDKPFSEFRVLLVNDDGIEAEGLAVLEEFARQTFGEVFVVAPAREHSGQAHSVTYRQEMRADKLSDCRYMFHGTPTDCALFGLLHVMRDKLPDLVLSGINHGDNSGDAITYSGTFGAAFEAGLIGIPAIALSQARFPDRKINFESAEENLHLVFDVLGGCDWPRHVVMNVNFPRVNKPDTAIHWTGVERRPIIEGVYVESDEGDRIFTRYQYTHIGDSEAVSDSGILARGGITITPVLTNWTCYETLGRIVPHPDPLPKGEGEEWSSHDP